MTFLSAIIRRNERLIEQLTKPHVPATWEHFAGPFSIAHDQLTKITARHTDTMDADTAAEVQRHRASLFVDGAIFAKYRALRASSEFPTLPPETRRLITRDLASLERYEHVTDRKRFIDASAELARQSLLLFRAPPHGVALGHQIRAVLRLRRQLAHLQGMSNAAEEALQGSALKSPAKVRAFLEPLIRAVRPHVVHEMQEIRGVADVVQVESLTPESIKALSDHLWQVRFGECVDEVHRYLPADTLLNGLSNLLNRLFGLRLCDAGAAPANPFALASSLVDSSRHVIAELHFDLDDRQEKDQRGWQARMLPLDDRRINGMPIPAALVQCRFETSSIEGRRCLSHRDLQILLHEVGHALHHVLAEVPHGGVDRAGAVERDSLEVPSRLMEEFAWDWDAVQLLTSHYKSREPLPRALFDELVASRDFHRGLELAESLLVSLFDLHLHDDYDPDGSQTPLEVFNDLRALIYGEELPPFDALPELAVSVFASHYAQAHYGYLYSEALAADVFRVFRGEGTLSRAVGNRLHREIFAVGASRPFLDSVKAFLGREPNLGAIRLPAGAPPPALQDDLPRNVALA